MVLSYQMMGSSLWVKLSLGHIIYFASLRMCEAAFTSSSRQYGESLKNEDKNLPELEALLFTSLGAHACGSFFI